MGAVMNRTMAATLVVAFATVGTVVAADERRPQLMTLECEADIAQPYPAAGIPGLLWYECDDVERLLSLHLSLELVDLGPNQTYDRCVLEEKDADGRTLISLSCTAEAAYDFRVRPQGSGFGTVKFGVVADSRAFGSIVIDARVWCADGSFYDPEDSLLTQDSTGPLAAGQAGEVHYDVRECEGAYSKIELTPRFPEWRCRGCGEHVPQTDDE